ncbi:hypothetical protein B0H19DRAFT_1070326 [Mycena capillaripes]|nr:hypothetical protein B0H19DRAFT_1070326 [Mycena capillaripes]
MTAPNRIKGPGRRRHQSEESSTFESVREQQEKRRSRPVFGRRGLNPGLPLTVSSFTAMKEAAFPHTTVRLGSQFQTEVNGNLEAPPDINRRGKQGSSSSSEAPQKVNNDQVIETVGPLRQNLLTLMNGWRLNTIVAIEGPKRLRSIAGEEKGDSFPSWHRWEEPRLECLVAGTHRKLGKIVGTLIRDAGR